MIKRIFIIGLLNILLLNSTNILAIEMDTDDKDFDYKSQPDSFWRSKLSKEVYNICRAQGTERAFSGQYDKFYQKGTYYCACCGGDYPLYSSDAKFNSGTGWPSFWQPFNEESVEYKQDTRFKSWVFGATTEVVCKRCGGHLGHVFDDGPKEYTGKRHCINSLALVFVPEGESPKRSFDTN